MVDVYIVFKRTKRDTRFGFARFINIGDLESFERSLRGILIGNAKLVINHSKFIKVRDSDIPPSEFPQLSSEVHPKLQVGKTSYYHSLKQQWWALQGILIPKIEEDQYLWFKT